MDIDLRPRQNPAGQEAARRLFCDAQQALWPGLGSASVHPHDPAKQ